MVAERTINDRFLVVVPYARVYNPINNENWEGVGVTPDIQVPASEALDAACKDAASRISTRARAAGN
jgi:retinol-binding protein 3